MKTDFPQNIRHRIWALWSLSLLLIVPLAFFPLITELENQVLDRFFGIRGARPSPPELLIVGIDEASFQELRLAWPWPRSLHARLIDRLSAAGARLVIFDVLFTEPTDPENDAALASAIQRAGNVLLAETCDYTDERLFTRVIDIRPIGLFENAAKGTGMAMIKPDSDGGVRHFQARIEGKPTLPALAYHAAGRPELPPDCSGLIKFVGPARSIDTLSYSQILDDEHPVPAERIRDRIVLVGRELQASPAPLGQTDLFPTPFFSITGTYTSGVEIHANIIHNLLTGRWLREISVTAKLIACFGYFLLFSLMVAAVPPVRGLIALGMSSLGLTAICYLLFSALDFWAPPVLFVIGTTSIYTCSVVLQYLAEARQKKWLRGAFDRYVSPEVVQSIVNNPSSLELGGQEIEATIFFSDLADFTSFSERLHPSDLVSLLIEYFTPMTNIILEHRGALDKFIGDAIMAFWGAPLPLENHARYACEAALAMKKSLAALQEGWRQRKLPLLKARMGIHSGPVVAGNVGSSQRFNYTVLGDTVNLASRLEGANKLYGTTILISEDTFRLAGPAFLSRELDMIRVKGRSAPVKIYELIGKHGENELPFLDTFAEGLAAYRNRLWERAELRFGSIAALDPPSKTYVERCRLYKAEPPPENWDGAFTQKAK
ncbi:MAG TPA: adenylate/guanylate cyclase domain-containing protein [Syntrophobacteraceae bacterium]|nr:adenylate/guanylate cyclase domain-containing protein [Syntrophobacteraceae bacterium]